MRTKHILTILVLVVSVAVMMSMAPW